MNDKLFVLCVFASFLISVSADDVLGCGGFIKSHVPIDYSKVEVKLLTKQGILKDRTSCAPNSGYYFIPLYDKGEYVLELEPPPGWSFDPIKIDVNVNGKTDACSKGHDINFKFKGFGITGKVESYGSSDGPAGVQVKLITEMEVRTTTTTEKGLFFFTPVYPGLHTVSISHPKILQHMSLTDPEVILNTDEESIVPLLRLFPSLVSFANIQKIDNDWRLLRNSGFKYNREEDIEQFWLEVNSEKYSDGRGAEISFSGLWKLLRNRVIVTVAEGNTELAKKSLIILGYDVSGVVRSDGESIQGAILMLYSEKKLNIRIEDCIKTPPDNIQMEENYLCYVPSDDKGNFVFPSVPVGKYIIVPFYRGQNIHFSPQSVDFTVEHDSLQILQPFEIVGFSVFGRILSSEAGRPLVGATIYLNDHEVGKTDEHGIYALEKIKAGFYTLSVRADNYQFDQRTVKINPSVSQLPEMYPTAYMVCGKVASERSRLVTVTRIGSTQHFSINTDPQTGKFCEYLKPGKYQIEVRLSDLDRHSGVQFFPISQTIEVSKRPILDMIFSQLKATVSGKVDCRRPKDCLDLKIILRPIINDIPQENKDLSMDLKGDSYIFTDVRPGIYEVLLTPNRLCWKQDKSIISITSTVLTVPTFIQTGYSIIFISSHDTQLSVKLPHQVKVLDIPQGKTYQCVENSGKHIFTISSCHTYTTNQIEFDTESDNNEVMITALKHKHSIGIKCPKDFGNITVKINIDGHKTISDPLVYANNQYTLELYLTAQESVILIPESEILYFNPPILLIEGKDDCQDFKDLFEAVKGRVFKGRVTPPLAGVQITVRADNSETLMNETDSNGFYQFHPLDDTRDYQITAAKDSYILVGPDDRGNFMAHKLAEIIVEVVDEHTKQPLQGALLSLSGDHSYRSNLQTNENGKITFHSLSPSEYFLKPMMKEYSFEPSSKIIDVKEGAAVRVKLTGKRVAYSAYGQVTSLNSDPEERVNVIAEGLGNCSQFSEDSTSESNGQFRIRGLLPYCSYSLQVKPSQFERSSPKSILLERISEDVSNLKLVVFRQVRTVDVLGKIYTPNPEHYKSLKVKLIRESPPSGIVSQVKIDGLNLKFTDSLNHGIIVHLGTVPLDNKFYSVQLETGLSPYNKYKLPGEHFIANGSFKYIDLSFVLTSNVAEHNIKQTSGWSLVLLFLIIAVICNIDKILIILKEVMAKVNVEAIIQNLRNHERQFVNDNNDIDQIVESINATKKKPKPKKI